MLGLYLDKWWWANTRSITMVVVFTIAVVLLDLYCGWCMPSKHEALTYAVLILAHRFSRWPSIKTALGQCLLFCHMTGVVETLPISRNSTNQHSDCDWARWEHCSSNKARYDWLGKENNQFPISSTAYWDSGRTLVRRQLGFIVITIILGFVVMV